MKQDPWDEVGWGKEPVILPAQETVKASEDSHPGLVYLLQKHGN